MSKIGHLAGTRVQSRARKQAGRLAISHPKILACFHPLLYSRGSERQYVICRGFREYSRLRRFEIYHMTAAPIHGSSLGILPGRCPY